MDEIEELDQFKIYEGFEACQNIPKHAISLFRIYGIESSNQGDKKYSKTAFKHVQELILTKHYFFTEYCHPLENHSIGDPDGFWDKVNELVEKSLNEVESNEEDTYLPENDYNDFAPLPDGITEEDILSGKVKMADLSPEIELTRFQKEYQDYWDWSFRREAKRQFFGKSYYYAKYRLYTNHLQWGFVLNPEHGQFDLFFAFHIRHLDPARELPSFLIYWEEQLSYDMEIYLRQLLDKYEALFQKSTKRVLKSWEKVEKKSNKENTIPKNAHPTPLSNKFDSEIFSDEAIQKLLEEHLYFLKNEYIADVPYLNDQNYQQLMEHSVSFLKTFQIQEINEKFSIPHITTESIQYTYYLIWKNLPNKRGKRDCFTQFLKATFQHFNKTELPTIHKKFSTKPKKYPY